MPAPPLRALDAPAEILRQHFLQDQRRPLPGVIRQHPPAEFVLQVEQQPIVAFREPHPPGQLQLPDERGRRPLPLAGGLSLRHSFVRLPPAPDPPAGQRIHGAPPHDPRQVRQRIQRSPAPAETLAPTLALQGAEKAIEPRTAPEVVGRSEPREHLPPVLPGTQPEPPPLQSQQQVRRGQPGVALEPRVPGATDLHLPEPRPPHHIPDPALRGVDHLRQHRLRRQRLFFPEMFPHPVAEFRVEVAEPPQQPRAGRPVRAPHEQPVVAPAHRRLRLGPDFELQAQRIRQLRALRRREPGQQLVVEFHRRRRRAARLERPGLQPLPHPVGEGGTRRAARAAARSPRADVETGQERGGGETGPQVRAGQSDPPLRIERLRQRDFAGLVALPETRLQLAQPVPRRPGQPPERFGGAERLVDNGLVEPQTGRLPEEVHLQQPIGGLHAQTVRPDRTDGVPSVPGSADAAGVQPADGFAERPDPLRPGRRQALEQLVERVVPHDGRHPVRREDLRLDQVVHEGRHFVRRSVRGHLCHGLRQLRRGSASFGPTERRIQDRGRLDELRFVADLAAALAELHILVAPRDRRQGVVRPVAGRAADLRVAAQPVGERRQFSQVQRGSAAAAGQIGEPEPGLPAHFADGNPGEQPERRAPVAHPGEVLDQGAVEPRPLPRRPLPGIRVHRVLQAGTGDPQGVAHGRGREDALQLATKRCFPRRPGRGSLAGGRRRPVPPAAEGRRREQRRPQDEEAGRPELPGQRAGSRRCAGCLLSHGRGERLPGARRARYEDSPGPGQDSRSSRSQAGSVSVMAASRARPMPAEPPRNEASSTKPCLPSTSAQAWKPPTPTPGLR